MQLSASLLMDRAQPVACFCTASKVRRVGTILKHLLGEGKEKRQTVHFTKLNFYSLAFSIANLLTPDLT